MAQQAPFEKLKEQIEAAKRGLTEISSSEIANGPNNMSFAAPKNDFLPSASLTIVEPETIKVNSGDPSCDDSGNNKVVDIPTKTVLGDPPIVNDTFGQAADISAGEFQFFHRADQPKGSACLPLDISVEESSSVEAKAEVCLFEQLAPRLVALEGDVEQNRKYIVELINLLSQLDLRQEPANKKSRPLQVLNRRYAFWLVIGFLAVGWFCLTPSGHLAVQYFLALI